ncbi:hypothetical protein [Humisphaera borealis]|uniref:Uncharacterized protein n=1 Tax=Humisphaera borealis TaxID=2807512 RepID=A0A7M2WU49_9BACT|nr:hypothetical protein [Humisphaera borealis]QOV88794.1 hypothetical protein IPV69_21600 [Humisphaera borealis]
MRFSRLARVGVLGVCASALVAGSIGCSTFRNEWPSKRMARGYTPPATQPTVMAPVAEADAFTYPAIDHLPAGVQASFTRDNPSSPIVAVEQVPSGSGPMLYRVTSLQDGTPVVSSYRSTGADLHPPEIVVIRPNDSDRPKAKYAPKPEGGVPAKGTQSGAID